MKKEVYILAVLAAFPAVSAQSLEIAGFELSILTLIPLALIVIVVLFFVSIFVKDKLTSSKKKIQPVKAQVKPGPIKEESHEEKKIKVKKSKDFNENIFPSILKKVIQLKSDADEDENKILIYNLGHLTRKYLKAKYELRREFGFGEIQSLAPLNQQESAITTALNTLQFSGQDTSKQEIKRLIFILEKLTRHQLPKTHQTHSFVESFMKRFAKPPEIPSPTSTPLKEKQYASKTFPVIKRPSFIEVARHSITEPLKIKKIHKLLRKGLKLASKNTKKAKICYGKALELYYNISIKEEKSIVNTLGMLYERIQEHELQSILPVKEQTKKLLLLKKAQERYHPEAKILLEKIKSQLRRESRIITKELKKESHLLVKAEQDSFSFFQQIHPLRWMKRKTKRELNKVEKNLESSAELLKLHLRKDVRRLEVSAKQKTEQLKETEKKIKKPFIQWFKKKAKRERILKDIPIPQPVIRQQQTLETLLKTKKQKIFLAKSVIKQPEDPLKIFKQAIKATSKALESGKFIPRIQKLPRLEPIFTFNAETQKVSKEVPVKIPILRKLQSKKEISHQTPQKVPQIIKRKHLPKIIQTLENEKTKLLQKLQNPLPSNDIPSRDQLRKRVSVMNAEKSSYKPRQLKIDRKTLHTIHQLEEEKTRLQEELQSSLR